MRDKSTWLFAALLIVSLGVFLNRTSLPNIRVLVETDTTTATPEYIDNWREVQQLSISSNPEAEVQLIEFVDYECPVCRRLQFTLDTLKQQYTFGVTVLQYPLTMHRFANRLANMAECARKEGRFLEMNDLLYSRLDSIGIKPWEAYGRMAGIKNINRWKACIETNGSQEVIASHVERGKALNIQGTPTVIINGRMLSVPPSVLRVGAVIDSVLQGKPFSKKGD